jgi:hypothetical protein
MLAGVMHFMHIVGQCRLERRLFEVDLSVQPSHVLGGPLLLTSAGAWAPCRSRNLPSRCRARCRCCLASSRARTRSRSASWAASGTQAAPSNRRCANTVQASRRRVGLFSRGRPLWLVPAKARSLPSSPPAASTANTKHTRSDPLHTDARSTGTFSAAAARLNPD